MKEYICKYCGKEFNKPQEVGGHVLNKHKPKEVRGNIKLKIVREEEYNKNPILCKKCGKKLSYKQFVINKNAIFCSKSCFVSINNKNKKNIRFCLFCNKELGVYQRKFCGRECSIKYRRKKYINEWLTVGSFHLNESCGVPRQVRDFLLEEQNNKCAICNLENIWNNKPIVFIADHIDGDSSNNKRENLRMICPNCNSQTDTFAGRNLGKGRFYRRERYRLGKSS